MAIKFLSGQTIDGTLTVSGNVQGATFNGLAINTTGTNNVANQIVRTQANGYTNFGWINSVSGNHTGSITRITASNDAYLRYVTPAQFRTGVTDGYYAPVSTVSGVTSISHGNGITATPNPIISTGTITMSGSYTGTFTASSIVGTNNITIASTVLTQSGQGRIKHDGSGDNYMLFGPYNDNGWGYIESYNNVNGIYFNTNQGGFLFDTGSLGSYTDAEVDLGYSGRRFRNINISASATIGGAITAGGIIYASGGNSNTWNSHTSNTGTVTSVATGNGLTGGTITTSGTLSMSGSYTGAFTATDTIQGYGLTSQNKRGNSGKVPQGHYAGGETVWEMDNTWSSQQLADYFNYSVSNVYWTEVADAPGGNCIYINGGVNIGGVYGSGFPYLPVETNSQQQADYYMEVWIQNVGTNQSHYMGSNEFNEGFGSLGGNPGSYGYWVMSNSNPGTGWTKYSAYIGGFSSSTVGMFELGTKYWTPMALLNYGAGSGTRACRISGWKVIKVQRAAKINMSGNDIIKIGDLIGEVGLDIKVDNGTTNAITIDNVGSTTFSGYTYFPNYLFHQGDTNTRIQFTTGTVTVRGDTSILLDGPVTANQNISTNSVYCSNVYNSGWFRNSVNNVGLYNSSSGNHFSANGGYWDVGYGGTNGIRLRNGHNGTILGYLYAETSGQFGLLDKDGQWTLRTDGTSETELRANNIIGFKVNSSGQMFLPQYTTTNTSTNPSTAVNPVQTFNPAGGVLSDTTTDLGVMANGDVVGTTQEATFSYTRAQIDALPTGNNGGRILLNAPGANKFIIVEKATFQLNYNYNGGQMSSTQRYEIQQDGSQSDAIAVMNGTRVNDVTYQSGASSYNYGIFEHDSGFATLNRTYQPNKAVTFRRTSTSSLASSVAQIRIKLRYRLWDATTF